MKGVLFKDEGSRGNLINEETQKPADDEDEELR
jgi:hypothetical protein